MKQLITFTLAAFFILPLPAFAEIKAVTHTVQQPFGGSQSPDDARTAGIARAKREALERFGTYIESTTVVKNSQVDSDEILALTAGVTKVEVIKQRNYTDGDGFGLEITVKLELDTAVLEKTLRRLLEDRNHLKDLKAARVREKKLLARIAELEKENQQRGKTKQQTEKLKEAFHAASQGLTAAEWSDKALALWEGGKYSEPERAIEYYTQAIRLDPSGAQAYSLRGIVFHKLKQFDRAIADYDQTIRLDPNDASAYSIRGGVYFELKQFDRAIADYDKAIRLDPNCAETYILRGVAYENLKQFDRAIADYDQVIRLDPNLAGAHFLRGIAYANLKKFDRAIADYDKAIRLDPNDARAHNNRGIAYLLINKAQNGCADLEKACTLEECDGYEYARQQKLCR